MKQDNVYKLTLLYRNSRDGDKVAKFRELCNGKGPTIAVGKVSGAEEILGGYNPLSWGSNDGYAETKESFLFTLDKNMDKCIVSFVDNNHSSKAIWDNNSCFPTFGTDLYFGSSNSRYVTKPYAKKKAYQLPVFSISRRSKPEELPKTYKNSKKILKSKIKRMKKE